MTVTANAATLEHTLQRLISRPGLDSWAERSSGQADSLRSALRVWLHRAWTDRGETSARERDEARLLVQRIWYRIARLRFYWFEDPDAHANEQSSFLLAMEAELERTFDEWLAAQVPPIGAVAENAERTLETWFERDRTPQESDDRAYLAESMGLPGYRRLLEMTSLNGLVEASHLTRVLAGAADPIQSTLTRILIEEYGGGKLHRKHSTFFAAMLEGLGLSTRPEAYFEKVPWELLALINHGIHLTERRRHFIRFCGAFTYTETSTPVSFAAYARAAARLGLADGNDYWTLHIREDERHGRWMLDEVAVPIARRFPQRRSDLLRGYAEQRFLERLAGAAIARECRSADQEERS